MDVLCWEGGRLYAHLLQGTFVDAPLWAHPLLKRSRLLGRHEEGKGLQSASDTTIPSSQFFLPLPLYSLF